MGETPPSPEHQQSVERRQAVAERLKNIAEGEHREQINLLQRFIGRIAAHQAPYVYPREHKATLEKTWQAYRAVCPEGSEEERLIVHGFEVVLDHRDAQRLDAAKERLGVLLAHPAMQAAIAHERAYEAATNASVQRIQSATGVPDTGREAIATAITRPPRKPPAGTHADLQKEFDAIKEERRRFLFTDFATAVEEDRPAHNAELGKRWQAHMQRVETYEAKCRAAGREMFLKTMNFPTDVTQEEFQEFIQSLGRRILPPDQARDPVHAKNPKVLALYKKLEEQRGTISRSLQEATRRNLEGDIGKDVATTIFEFLANRDLYERKVLQKPEQDNDKWLLYAGVVINEAAEELAEGWLSWEALNKKTIQQVPLLRQVDAATRKAIIGGWSKASEMLGKAASVTMLGRMLNFMTNKVGVGGTFLAELFKVESPVTVLLWGMYLHESPNKVKATMQFASFIAVGNATSKLMRLGQSARFLKIVPKNNVAVFAAAMAVAFIAADKIDQFCTWIDKEIPESASKDAAGRILSLISGDSAIGALEEISEQVGISRVDPDRDFKSYMTREANLTQGVGKTLSGDYFHSIDEWNKRVDQAIADAKEAKESPMLIALWEQQKISPEKLQEWGEAQSVYLHIQVPALIAQERDMEKRLRAKGVLAQDETLGGVALATHDGDRKHRNDRTVRYAMGEGQGSAALKKAREYFQKMESADPKDPVPTDPDYRAWTSYRTLLGDIARDVGLYNYLGVYKREAWLGDLGRYEGQENAPMTDTVQRGLVAQIGRQIRSNRATSRDQYPGMSAEQFAAELAKAIKTHEKVGIVGGILQDFDALAKEYRGPGINIFKGAQTMNAPTHTVRMDLFMLMQDLHSASRELTKEQMQEFLREVQALVVSREIITSQQIRDIRERISTARLNRLSGRKMYPADSDLRQRLGIKDAPFFSQGSISGPIWVQKGNFEVDYLAGLGYNWNKVRKDGYDMRFEDLVLLQSDVDSHSVRLFSFRCPSSDRKQWSVRTTASTTNILYEKGNTTRTVISTKPSSVAVLSYEDFAKTYPQLVAGLDEQFRLIEARRSKEEGEEKSLGVKYEEEKAQLKKEYITKYEAEWKTKKGDMKMYKVHRIPDQKNPGKFIEFPVYMGTAGELLEKCTKETAEIQRIIRERNVNVGRVRDDWNFTMKSFADAPYGWERDTLKKRDESKVLEERKMLESHLDMYQHRELIVQEMMNVFRMLRKYQDAIITDEKEKKQEKPGWRVFDQQYTPEQFAQWLDYLEQKEGIRLQFKDLILFACTSEKESKTRDAMTQALSKKYPEFMLRPAMFAWRMRENLSHYPEVFTLDLLQKAREHIDKEAGRGNELALNKEAEDHAETVARWRLRVRTAACRQKFLSLVPVAPGAREMVYVGRYRDPAAGIDEVIVTYPYAYERGWDGAEKDRWESRIYQPESARGHASTYYRFSATTDLATLDLRDVSKAPGVGHWTIINDLQHDGNTAEGHKRFVRTLITQPLLNGQTGFEDRLTRLLNLFPYEIRDPGSKTGYNMKHKLLDAIKKLYSHMDDETVFFNKLLDTLIERKLADGGICKSSVEAIGKDMQRHWLQWGFKPGAWGDEVETKIKKLFDL
ncbi:MAG: hypothetical protein G01um101425_344 [Candidatus Peregrinibacteria bacterium Gr01-1014_25]|nr:MAG: hypothetical protein G01um101425_344 [Candidatus Peregrinibacteria bacterium Gr01-1014_25]